MFHCSGELVCVAGVVEEHEEGRYRNATYDPEGTKGVREAGRVYLYVPREACPGWPNGGRYNMY